jgi:hypothetical protein
MVFLAPPSSLFTDTIEGTYNMDNPLSLHPRESPSDPCAAYYYSFLVHMQRDTMLSIYIAYDTSIVDTT